MSNQLIQTIATELETRGYDVKVMDILNTIAYKNGYQVCIIFPSEIDKNDDESTLCIMIAANQLMSDNALSRLVKLRICNHVNKEQSLCSVCLADEDEEHFVIKAHVPMHWDDLSQICADVFEDVIETADFLIEVIEECDN